MGDACRADFPAYLWDVKAFPFVAVPFWGMRKSMPSTVIVQSLSTSCAPNLLSNTICGGGGGGGWGGEDQMLGKKT